MKHVLVGILIILSLAGCATKTTMGPPSQATLQTRELEPSAGKALVYYYNDKMFLRVTTVSLDGVLSEIKKNRYVVWEVSPGEHHLEFTRTGLSPEIVTTDITCEADQIYFFHMAGHDKETHEIVQAEDETGRTKIERFALAKWFKDGVEVTVKEEKE